jgi:hypothetical protein
MENTGKETVTTMDGETVTVEDALCLNYGRVLSCLLAVKRDSQKQELAKQLQKLLETLKASPSHFAISGPDTATAKQLSEIISTIRVREPAPPIWISYNEAFANWEKHQPSKMAPAAPANNALEAAERAAKRAAERIRKEKEENQKQAAALEALIPQSVDEEFEKIERAAIKSRKNELREIIRPFATGQARVDKNKRPAGLEVSENLGIPVTSYYDIIRESKAQKKELKDTELACAFCGEEHAVGEVETITNDRGETQEVFILREILLPALNENGSELYRHIQNDRAGQPKKLTVVCCSFCASIAFGITRNLGEKDPMKIWPKDLYRKVNTFLETEKERERQYSGLKTTLRECTKFRQ